MNSTPNLEEISGGHPKQQLEHGNMNYKPLYTTSRMQKKHNVKRKQEVHSRRKRKAQTTTKKYTGFLPSKGQHPTLFLVLKMGQIT